MKPSVIYFSLTAIFLTLAISFAANAPDRWMIGSDTSVESNVPFDRAEAIEIARRYVAVDEGDLESRLIVEPKPMRDGGWHVGLKWCVDGDMRYAMITVDPQGRVVEFIR